MRHLYSFYAIATFVNNQYLTTALAYDAAGLSECLFGVFKLIPTVGPCVSTYFVSTVQAFALLIDWVIRFSMGLAFLAYYAVTGVQSFLTARGYALASLLSIVNSVTNSSLPNSTSSCQTFALNTAFAFPPVGCSDCVVGNFSAAPAASRKRSRDIDERFGVYKMFKGSSLHSSRRSQSWGDVRDKLRDLTHHTERFESTCTNPGQVLLTTANPFTLGKANKTHAQKIEENDNTNVLSFFSPIILGFLAPGRNNSLVDTPTDPPIALTCSNPTPTCFDVACSSRAFWNELYNVVFLMGNFLNSLVQDWDIGFPFFTTGDVPKCSYMCPR